MCSFEKIVMKAYGISPEKMSVENIGNNDPEFERSSILLWCSRADVPINGMIKYDNHDSGNSYSYNLYNTEISNLQLLLTDEFDNNLETALDYTMSLQFEIYEKDKRELYHEIGRISNYLREIYVNIMIMLEFIGILKTKDLPQVLQKNNIRYI